MVVLRKSGQPEKELNWEKLDLALRYGAPLKDCVGIVDLSTTSIQTKIKQEYGMTFSEYREMRMAPMRLSLLQKQYEVAMKGNVSMLIWLGKNILGQADKVEDTSPDKTINIIVERKDAEL